MSDNFNHRECSNERPPLPPKNLFKAAPPLPPKVYKQKEVFPKIKRPHSSSKELFRNNNSYSLTSIGNNVIVKPSNTIEKKEVYENYQTNGEKSKVKKCSLLSKMKKLLKKPKKYKQSKNDEVATSESSIIVSNKYNEIPDCINCSNVTICTHCFRCCHCLFQSLHHHHMRYISSYSCHENHSIPSTNTCNSHYDCSSCNSISSQIVPSSIRLEPPKLKPKIQLPVDDPEQKPLVPVKRNPLAKYSNNFLNKNLMALKKVGWYWGSVSSEEAERLMSGQPDGTFMVRDSAHSEHLFSVTFRVNHLTHHARIQFSQNKFWWNHNNQDDGFESVIDLIEKSMEISQRGEYRYFENTENVAVPPYAVSLLKPLSRFNVMSSLKHLTRFVIISNVRSDHLEQLPLPPHLLSYLSDKEHHYIENFDRYVNMIDTIESQSIG